MENVETIFGTWPVAFTIVASVVAIVTGLFGYLRVNKHNIKDIQQEGEIVNLNTKVISMKERLAKATTDIFYLRQQVSMLESELSKHEGYDIKEFSRLSRKIDKLSDIIIEMLDEDKEEG